MAESKSGKEYGFQEILNQAPRSLHDYEEGFRYTVEDIDDTRYIIFPSQRPITEMEGIGIMTAERIKSLLDDDKKYPVLRTLDMSLERINKENREDGSLLVAKAANGEIYDMGYLVQDGEIQSAWPYKKEKSY